MRSLSAFLRGETKAESKEEASCGPGTAVGDARPRLWVPRPAFATPTRGPKPPASAHVRPGPPSAGSRNDEPGPQGAEPVGGQGLLSPGGSRPHSASCYSPRAGAPGTRKKRTGLEKERAAAAKSPETHSHLGQTTNRPDTSRRVLPLSAYVSSGCGRGGAFLAPPHVGLPRPLDSRPNLTSAGSLEGSPGENRRGADLLASPAPAPVHLEAQGFKNECSVSFPLGKVGGKKPFPSYLTHNN